MADPLLISAMSTQQQHQPRIHFPSCSTRTSTTTTTTSSRYVSLPVSSLKLPLSRCSKPSRRHSHFVMHSSNFHLISTHEHIDGSLIFRFGNPSEVVENVDGKGVGEKSGSGGVGRSGLVSGKEEVVKVSEDNDGIENDEKTKNVKSRRRKKNKLVGDEKVEAESGVGVAEEIRMSSLVGSTARLEEGSEGRKDSLENDGLDEFPSSVAVSELETVVNVENDIGLTVLKEKSGSVETAACMPSSVMDSETVVPSTEKGTGEQSKAGVQHVTTMVEPAKDDTSSQEIINSFGNKVNSEEKDEAESAQMSKLVEDNIIDKQTNVTNEGVEVKTVEMSTIKDKVIDEKPPNVKVGTTQISKRPENGNIVQKQASVINEDIELETTKMPKTVEDNVFVGNQSVGTNEDFEVRITQVPKTQEDGIYVGKQSDVTKKDIEVETTPMAETEDGISFGQKPNATNEDAVVKSTPMPKTEEDDTVARKQSNLTNEDAMNVISQDPEVETTPMLKTEENDVGKQPDVTSKDLEEKTTQVLKAQEDVVVENQQNFTNVDAEVGSLPLSNKQENGVAEKQPNITNDDVEVEAIQMSKTLEDDKTVVKGLDVTNEDVSEGDEIGLLPFLPIEEAEPRLVQETTTETLDESSQTGNTESLKLIDDDTVNLKSKEESIQFAEDNSNISNQSTLQENELQSTATVLNREQDVAEGLVLSSGVASLRHTAEELTGRDDAYFVYDNWLGVADGVGQWALEGTKSGQYAQELTENCKKIVSESKSSRVSKPDEVLLRAAAETDSQGSSTLLVAHFDGQALHVANIGDLGFVIIRNSGVFAKSSPMHHEFNFPVHFGAEDDPSKLMERYEVDLEEGDVIVLATDGLFDNLYEQEIALMVTKSLQGNLKAEEIAELLASSAQELGQSTSARSPFADAAQAAGYVGYTGGKLDHITVIVSLVQ